MSMQTTVSSSLFVKHDININISISIRYQKEVLKKLSELSFTLWCTNNDKYIDIPHSVGHSINCIHRKINKNKPIIMTFVFG